MKGLDSSLRKQLKIGLEKVARIKQWVENCHNQFSFQKDNGLKKTESPWRAAALLGRLRPTPPLNGLILVFEETPMVFIQLQSRAVIPCPTLKACQTQAKLVSCGGAQCRALCRGKVHSTAPHILQMSGTQHRNKMVFPDGSHPRDNILQKDGLRKTLSASGTVCSLPLSDEEILSLIFSSKEKQHQNWHSDVAEVRFCREGLLLIARKWQLLSFLCFKEGGPLQTLGQCRKRQACPLPPEDLASVLQNKNTAGKCNLCFVHTYLYFIEILSCFKGDNV
ncbi:hypothetical protein EK904_011421, partial [Melospiza melodia maxima]